MSDARVRDLVRRARQGDVEAGVQLISERRRNGTLSRERVWVAAALGDEAARLVEGVPFDEGRAQGWVEWPASQGREVAVRMLAAALDLTWRETRAICFDPDARRFVEVMLGFLGRWLDAAPAVRRSVEADAPAPAHSTLPAPRVARAALGCVMHDATNAWVWGTTEGVMTAVRATSEAATRRALRDAVVPWALGL